MGVVHFSTPLCSTVVLSTCPAIEMFANFALPLDAKSQQLGSNLGTEMKTILYGLYRR